MNNLLEQIRSAGVAGCGGAGFPTHVKLAAQGVDTLIINAAECEPLLRTDRFLMLHKAAEIISTVAAVKEHLHATRAVIALKETYLEEIRALQTAIERANTSIELHRLKSFYPAGDEQVMVFEVTGRVVPPAGLPLDVQCVVSNAATMLSVYHAMQSRPFTQKYLTINGAVNEPCVIKAPIGTSFAECLALAGGAQIEDYTVISGGPMMGKPCPSEEAANLYVTKTTSGFLVLPSHIKLAQLANTPLRHMQNRARSACIQCSFCTQLCPRYLLGHPIEPHKIMRKFAAGQPLEDQLDSSVLRSAQYCCECGVCELVACPMQLNPRSVNRQIKQALSAQSIHPIKGKAGLQPRPYRAERAIPTGRAAMSAGVGRWYHAEIPRFAEAVPESVHISLNSHIGAPAEPIVKVGEKISFGQCIAQPPEGKLGVLYHATIGGTIEYIGENFIVIARETTIIITKNEGV